MFVLLLDAHVRDQNHYHIPQRAFKQSLPKRRTVPIKTRNQYTESQPTRGVDIDDKLQSKSTEDVPVKKFRLEQSLPDEDDESLKDQRDRLFRGKTRLKQHIQMQPLLAGFDAGSSQEDTVSMT